MIVNGRVLEDEFTPEEVEHRHDEVNRLSGALDPAATGGNPENTFLFGPTGTGKTCIARFTVSELEEEYPEINRQYVNCWQNYNRFRVLHRLLEGVGKATDIRRQSTPKDELIERLRQVDDKPYIVILDEVDQLADTEVLYDLYSLPHVTMILIANREEELFLHIDDRVASRLRGSPRIQFQKYHVDELVQILGKRVEWGLEPGVISESELEFIANTAVGDARVAINILRASAKYAQREGYDEITEDVISEAVPEAKTHIKQKNLEKLNDHQRVLYEIIAEHEELPSAELYEEYENRIDDPMVRRTVRNYLTKLVHYNLIEAEGENRSRRYRVVTSSH